MSTGMTDELVSGFFNLAASTLQQEDQILRKHFQEAFDQRGQYRDVHQGILHVSYETAFVYTIWRALIVSDFPLECRWEYQYPEPKSRQRADLAFLGNEGSAADPIACVEAKGLWGEVNRDVERVKADVQKMREVWRAARKFILLFWDDTRRPEPDEFNDLGLQSRPGWVREFPTWWYETSNGHKSIQAVISLLEVV